MFHIKTLNKDLLVKEQDDPEEEARLEESWGPRYMSKTEFLTARPGDHLLVPFECDDCIFVKLRGTLPDYSQQMDLLLLKCIRRINLDAFWSRSTLTVNSNAISARMQLKMSQLVGLEGPFIHTQSLPLFDHCGYEVAIGHVLYSMRPGRSDPTYTQFDTIRSLRTVYSNFIRASPQSNSITLSLGDFQGNYHRLVTDQCGSFWFKRFMTGMKNRMGQLWRPNKALSIRLLKAIITSVETRIATAGSFESYHKWSIFSAYVVLTYVLSLRGSEGFILDTQGILDNWTKGGDKYIIIALLGKVKGEHHRRLHLLPAVHITSSGINVKDTVLRVLKIKRKLNLKDGPLISNEKGILLPSRAVDDMLIEVLSEIFEESPDLFPGDVKTLEDIPSSYQCFRTFRRTSNTRAVEKKVSLTDQQVVNRWRAFETAAGKRPALPMHMHYAQMEELLEPFLRYTRAM